MKASALCLVPELLLKADRLHAVAVRDRSCSWRGVSAQVGVRLPAGWGELVGRVVRAWCAAQGLPHPSRLPGRRGPCAP